MVVETRTYDAVVIGSGQAGGPLSTALVTSGRKTALIERDHIGGTCINEGCTPTKTMVASGRVAYLARRGADYGVRTGPVEIDMVKVRQRKRDIVDEFRNGSTNSIKKGGVDIIMGEACFTGPRTVEVHEDDGNVVQITADLIFINTGARPANPPLDGLDSVPALNSTTIMDLDEVPQHLLVLGGGYIGLEFSQLFRRLGSQVTIVQLDAHLMGREDDDIADEVAKILREDGIDILLSTSATRVEPGEQGIRLHVRNADGERVLEGTHLLVAVGRKPNTDKLRVEAAGVKLDKRGYVDVNDRLETGVPGIYAMGDVAGSPNFTHISYDDFRIVRDNLLHGGNRNRQDRLIPYTMFTDPQLGRVGITETEARTQGLNIKVAKMPMNWIARALEVDESRGLMKAVVDADTGQILGVAVLGLEGGEIMAMLEIAIMGKLHYKVLQNGIFAHPTLAESFNNLFGTIE
jgi:pyruvate/2-oxoglutarate dehydrogenase complex dihydrolipoamide dehydrogenase (E3) component